MAGDRIDAVHPGWTARAGWLARPSVRLAALAIALLGGGCAVAPNVSDLPKQAVRPVPVPVEVDRDGLLDELAACHMLRVSQARDVRASDTAVLAALEHYGVTAEQLAARANALLPLARREGLAFRRAGERACAQVAEYTGVQSRLVKSRAVNTADSADIGGVWVRYEGDISTGLANKLATRLRREGAVGLIINSPGGSVYEARKLGRYLRANGLYVVVDRVCASACIDILAGGVSRYITEKARIGLHQSSAPSDVGSHNTGQSYVAASALYLREMGVDPDIALAAASVPPNNMYWISTAEAIETRLATGLIQSI